MFDAIPIREEGPWINMDRCMLQQRAWTGPNIFHFHPFCSHYLETLRNKWINNFRHVHSVIWNNGILDQMEQGCLGSSCYNLPLFRLWWINRSSRNGNHLDYKTVKSWMLMTAIYSDLFSGPRHIVAANIDIRIICNFMKLLWQQPQ